MLVPNVVTIIPGGAKGRSMLVCTALNTHTGAGNMALAITNYQIFGENVPCHVIFATLTNIYLLQNGLCY